jgi:phospholipid/cholesterol/gamma-HCH transport system substrate-binding protein
LRRSREASVGFVILLAGVALIVAILAVGKESRLFTRKVEYWTAFPNVSGLAEGSPVQLVGVQVGTVSRVEFSPEIADRQIRVVLEVDRHYADRIREGTQALIKSLSYVSQERFIELTPGDPERPLLLPGSRIEPGLSSLAELTQMGRGIADDVKDITGQLRELLLALNKGGGILPEMIRNPDFGRDSLEGIQGTVTSIQRITGRIEKGEGLAGQLLMNKEMATRTMSRLEASLESVQKLLESIDSGQGALGELTAPGGKGEELLAKLDSVTSDLKGVVSQIKEGKGLAGRLFQDDEAGREILSNLQKTSAHLESITGKIDRGEGSIGALVNDPEVYEGLRDVVAGIRKSRMGKGMIHHYEKKGEKQRETESAEPPQDNP